MKFEFVGECSPLCEVCRTVGRGPVFIYQFTAICMECFKGMVDACPDEILAQVVGEERLTSLLPDEDGEEAPPDLGSTSDFPPANGAAPPTVTATAAQKPERAVPKGRGTRKSKGAKRK